MGKGPLRVGEFEEILMLLVQGLGSEASGFRIFKELELINWDTSVGATYTTLQRLEKKGLVKSWMGTEKESGKERRFYELDGSGQSALSQVEADRSAIRARFSNRFAGEGS